MARYQQVASVGHLIRGRDAATAVIRLRRGRRSAKLVGDLP